MAEKTHRIHLQPVDLEIEITEDETILEGAFRQGVLLMHGCKMGQCSACKSFLLDGDLEMSKYSTFALNNFEREEGYVLLCRSHAYSDLEIELIDFEEDMLRSTIVVKTMQTEVEEIETLTHDIRRLQLKILGTERISFKAGQYVDIRVPDTDETRAFSMSNAPSITDRLEFMIKILPGGLFSGLMESLQIGQELTVKGPYGAFQLREKTNSEIICIGGGSGMAPLWSLLNDMAERGVQRKATYFYGARTRKDLFYLDRLQQLTERLPGFSFVPALSHSTPEDEWDGETGLITDVLDRHLEAGQTETQAYLCGPPPMIDAAIPVLIRKGISENHIYFDKFTPTGKA